jgi:PTS system nitrogen regulatory IIA component
MNNINDESLAELVKRGGVYHNIPGSSPREILSDIIDSLQVFPLEKKAALLQAILEREALITTGVGRGIALPHPRNPILEEGENPFVTITFPIQPLDWNTLDGSKVHTIFLIVSKSTKQHLGVLSKINYLCQQEKFHKLISAGASKEEIVAAIAEAEKAWE